MQGETQFYTDDLEDSNHDLSFPHLPYADIHDLLTKSRQLHRSKSAITMSSITDDSSVDDSVSSVGQEEWEKVTPDYDSDTAAHEHISRVPTPLVDVQELQQTVLVFPPSLQEQQLRKQHHLQRGHAQELEGHLIPSAGSKDVEPGRDKNYENNEEHGQDEEDEQLYQEREEDEEDGDEEDEEEEEDVVGYWENVEDLQITFDERPKRNKRSKEQDVMLPLVKIVGATAERYTAGTEWQDLDHVAGVARMTLGENTLKLRRPMKLLYFGDEGFQGALEAKIGSALVSARDDREIANKRHVYNILPVSWDRESPQVELMPDSGANMDVETCILARKNATQQIELVLQSGETITSSQEGVLNSFTVTRGYQLPDLALFHITEGEDVNASSRIRAQEFMLRHSIPTITVSSSEKWRADYSQLLIDVKSPHFSIQVPGQSTSEAKVFKRLPIDADTFLRLNSLQLNKNLACMIFHDHSESRSLFTRYKCAVCKFEGSSLISSFARIMLAISLISMMLSTFIFSLSSIPRAADVKVCKAGASLKSVMTTATHSVQVPIAASVIPKVSNSIVPSVALIETPSKDLMAQMPAYEPNYSKAFEAQVFGDNFVIVRPPKWFADLKKAPELNFTIVKEEQPIKHNMTRLHERIYALEIPREHAYGIVDLLIQTKQTRKHAFAVNQTVQIDLGSAWAKLFDWLRITNGIVDGDKKASLSPEVILNSTKWLWTAATKVPRSYADQQREWLRTATTKMLRGWQTCNENDKRSGGTGEHCEKDSKDSGMEIKQIIEETRLRVHQWRKSHFQNEQKQLIKLWWRLSGKAPSNKQAMRKSQQMKKQDDKKAKRQL